MRFSEELPSSSASSVVHQQQQCNRMPRSASTNAGDSRSTSVGICRNLFGPVDHEENARFLNDQLSCMKKEARQRWNFDFENGTPIPGRFEWTPVLQPPVNPGDDAKVNQVCQQPQQQAEVTVARPLLRQTKITDHMPKQKRSRQGFQQDSGDRLMARTTSKTLLSKRPKLLQTATNVLESEWTINPGGQMNEAL